MRMTSKTFALLALFPIVASGPAAALPQSVFVSGAGADVANCGPVTAPCRTFQYAHDAVAPLGVIAVLDSGEYGPVAITKSVSIINNGAAVATISAPSATTPAIDIRERTARVVLRGLTIDGAKAGFSGVKVTQGRSVDISKCVIRNFASKGVELFGVTGAQFSFRIADSEVSDNATSGIEIIAAAGAAAGIVKNSALNRNGSGLSGRFTFRTVGAVGYNIVVHDVEAVGNATAFDASVFNDPNLITLTNVTASGPTAISAQFLGRMRVSRSTLAGAVINPSNLIGSSGDNTTTASPVPTLTVVPMK